MKLTIELVPKSSWYDNVRSQVDTATWDRLRRACYTKAKHVCEICKDHGLNQGAKWPVECHEIWEYNDVVKTQILKGLIALCPNCHQVKHFGRVTTQGVAQINKAIHHFCKVNQVDVAQAEVYIDRVFKIWKKRSQHKYTVDISFLNNLKEPGNGETIQTQKVGHGSL